MKCPDEQDLLEFLNGVNDPEKRRKIETHVDDCPICLELIADWAAEQLPTPKVDNEPAKEGLQLTRRTRLEQFTVLERIGAGAMGAVFAAYDHQLDRKVALKVLHRRDAVESEKIAKERLLREAKAMARLSHPNVVTVLGVHETAEQVVIAMEFVPGVTLRQWMRQTQRSWREILDVFLQAGFGLAVAHSAGLVHRDFKPDNVLIHEDGRALVSDFGLARDVNNQPQQSSTAETASFCGLDNTTPKFESLTQAGAVVGTPAYLAPEQISGQRATVKSDQFSYCVALYEALYGERPFTGETLHALKSDIDAGPPEPSSAVRQIPGWLHKVLTQGLSAHPEARYSSMESLLEDLRDDPQEARRQQQTARRRKMLVIGLALLAVCGPIGAWYGIKVQRAQSCAQVQTQLVGVWDGATKDAVRKSFWDTKKSFAAATWQRIERVIDTYTADWSHMHTEVCEATWLSSKQSEEVFDLRMRCLAKRLEELGALVKVFTKADAGVVQKAVKASSSLTGIAMCADEETLRAPYPPPKNPQIKAKVMDIREKLAEARALNSTGKHRQGFELVQDLEKQVNLIDYRPIKAEVLFELGCSLERAGEYKKAETTLLQAARVAAKSKDALLAAKAMTWLVRVVGYMQARHKEGLLLAQDTEVLLGLAREDEIVRATFFNTQGTVFFSKGDYDKALLYFQKVLAIREKKLGREHPNVSATLTNIGIVFRSKGDYEKAVEYYQKAYAIQEKVVGPDHPGVATTFNGLGNVFLIQGKHEKAQDSFRRSLRIYEQALGSEHPLVALALNNLGTVLHAQGEYDKAFEYLYRSLAIREKTLGPEHPLLAESLYNLGAIYQEQGEHDKALQYYKKSLRIWKKTLGPKHHDVAIPLIDMGSLSAVQGEYDKALEYYRKALAIQEKALGPQHPLLVKSLSGIGSVFMTQGRHNDALESLERVVSLCEKKTCYPASHGRGLFGLARALVATGADKPRALRLARQAYDLFIKTPKAYQKVIKEVDEWLKKHQPPRSQTTKRLGSRGAEPR